VLYQTSNYDSDLIHLQRNWAIYHESFQSPGARKIINQCLYRCSALWHTKYQVISNIMVLFISNCANMDQKMVSAPETCQTKWARMQQNGLVHLLAFQEIIYLIQGPCWFTEFVCGFWKRRGIVMELCCY